MHINISRRLRYLLISVLTLTVSISSAFAYKGIMYPKIIDEEIPVYNYTNKSDIKYTVDLKPNMIYGDISVGEGNTYISNYVDNINTTFLYEFIGEKASDISGEYDIVAVMEGYIEREEIIKTIWEKQYSLLPKSSFSIKDRSFSMRKDIAIKLEEFNNFAAQVIEDTESVVDIRLIVSMNVNIISKTDKGDIIEKLSPSLVIPINKNYFEIGKINTEEKKGAITVTKKITDPKNDTTSNFLFYTSMVLLAILLLIIFFTKNAPVSNSYVKSVLKLLKDNENRIVALEKEIVASEASCYNIKSFEDLTKISDEIGKPILYNYSSVPGNIRYFYVFDELRTYIFDYRAAMNDTESDNIGIKKQKNKNNFYNKQRKYEPEAKLTKDEDSHVKNI